jgi:hypothetical protein
VSSLASCGRRRQAGEAAATDRLRRALLAFRAARTRFLAARRKAKAPASGDEVDRSWATQGSGIEAAQHAAAEEVAGAAPARCRPVFGVFGGTAGVASCY